MHIYLSGRVIHSGINGINTVNSFIHSIKISWILVPAKAWVQYRGYNRDLWPFPQEPGIYFSEWEIWPEISWCSKSTQWGTWPSLGEGWEGQLISWWNESNMRLEKVIQERKKCTSEGVTMRKFLVLLKN